VTGFKSVKLHHYWPCTVCGKHTGGVNVLNVSEDGTVRVCKNCLKENYNRAATEREFAFIKYNSIL
jgi:transcription elongation factor Elf1